MTVLKRVALSLASAISVLWRLVPTRLRHGLFLGLFVLESRGQDESAALRRLFAVEDRLALTINERAMALGRGEHPKHRLTDYHAFFIARIPPEARVLDIGCGYGAVARSIATARPDCTILGMDMDAGRLAQAQAAANPANLSFLAGDATLDLPDGPWSVVILSNILEHVDDRIGLLRAVIKAAHPQKILLRVPLFERDWTMAMRREIGADYRSDPDHRIEHTLGDFTAEVMAAGLDIAELKTLWGEIWADCRPRDGAGEGA